MNDLRYPIGPFDWKREVTADEVATAIEEIGGMAQRLSAAVSALGDEQLDTPYRPGGWTVRQVVHHLPDSHLNAYLRFRLALTEEEPAIRPYEEKRWAELADARTAPVSASLRLLAALHERWTRLMRAMEPGDFRRAYLHPEIGRVPLDQAAVQYAWHGRHHTAQIIALRQRNGWGHP
jgi:uncharacterized damage-inducible protein DinB